MPYESEVRQAYTDFIQSYPWDYFFTITFRRPRRDMYASIRDGWDWARKCGADRAFVACEPHTTGMLHLHGLAHSSGALDTLQHLPTEPWNEAFRRFGRSKVERCQSFGNVSAYCAKYVTKGRGRYEYAFEGDWTQG